MDVETVLKELELLATELIKLYAIIVVILNLFAADLMDSTNPLSQRFSTFIKNLTD